MQENKKQFQQRITLEIKCGKTLKKDSKVECEFMEAVLNEEHHIQFIQIICC